MPVVSKHAADLIELWQRFYQLLLRRFELRPEEAGERLTNLGARLHIALVARPDDVLAPPRVTLFSEWGMSPRNMGTDGTFTVSATRTRGNVPSVPAWPPRRSATRTPTPASRWLRM